MNRNIEFRAWDNGRYYLESEIAYITNKGKVALMNGNILVKSTLLQFTGLTDVNGVKIFEGDIVLWEGYGHTHKYPVESLEETGGWKAEWMLSFTDIRQQQIKVIGNIFENSDLL